MTVCCSFFKFIYFLLPSHMGSHTQSLEDLSMDGYIYRSMDISPFLKDEYCRLWQELIMAKIVKEVQNDMLT